MADIVTMQQLEAASYDAASLKTFIHGGDAEDVLTRLNIRYPTLRKALKALFQNGGLPATPFDKYADLTASSLPDGSLGVVLNGDEAGLYKKADGVWSQTDYSLSQKKDAERVKQLERLLLINSNDAILHLLDNDDNSVLSILTDGGIKIFGLDKTIQDELSSIRAVAETASVNTVKSIPFDGQNLFAVVDDNDLVVLVVKNNGDIVTPLSDKPIIEWISEIESKLKTKLSACNTGYSKDIYNQYPLSSRSQTLLNTARAKYGSLAPLPFNLLQGSDTVGTNWVNSVSVDLSASSNLIKTTGIDYAYRDGVGVVHPYVVEFADKIAGYKYWLAITGYTQSDDRVENAFIYGSNDPNLRDWQLIDGFPQPFLNTPIDGFMGSTSVGELHSHHSDVGICYDPIVGDIVVYWRVSLYYKDGSYYKQGLYGCRYDGNGWSTPYFIIEPINDGDPLLSPAIIYNSIDNLFYMYHVAGGKIYYRTCPNLLGGGWTAIAMINIPNAVDYWHVEAKWVGNKIVLLIHSDDGMSGTGADALYFATSADGVNFNVSNQNIVSAPLNGFYKSSFLPLINGDVSNASFNIVYTTDGSTKPMFQLGIAKTNTVNLGA